MKYGYCLNHPNKVARNAKRLCDTCTKERHERAAASKGIITKSAKSKIEEDEFDNTRGRTAKLRSIQNADAFDGGQQGEICQTQKAASKKTKINPRSEKKKQEESELARIKSRKIRDLGGKCEMCTREGAVDLFHIITIGDKKFSTNPINLMLSCRFCHLVWGANDWGKIIKFKNFQDIMDRLKSLDEGRYWKLKHKIDEYLLKLQNKAL